MRSAPDDFATVLDPIDARDGVVQVAEFRLAARVPYLVEEVLDHPPYEAVLQGVFEKVGERPPVDGNRRVVELRVAFQPEVLVDRVTVRLTVVSVIERRAPLRTVSHEPVGPGQRFRRIEPYRRVVQIVGVRLQFPEPTL